MLSVLPWAAIRSPIGSCCALDLPRGTVKEREWDGLRAGLRYMLSTMDVAESGLPAVAVGVFEVDLLGRNVDRSGSSSRPVSE